MLSTIRMLDLGYGTLDIYSAIYQRRKNQPCCTTSTTNGPRRHLRVTKMSTSLVQRQPSPTQRTLSLLIFMMHTMQTMETLATCWNLIRMTATTTNIHSFLTLANLQIVSTNFNLNILQPSFIFLRLFVPFPATYIPSIMLP